ncbi:MAG: cytidine deaminase [Pikeienuella sp.]
MAEALISAAKAAAEQAHAPYSKFQVGAAILGEDGAVFSGCNIENAAYPQGWCAEPTAIGQMVMAGTRTIVAVCVYADSVRPCTPCGGCRQKLAEFSGPDTLVISAGPAGERGRWRLAELLPEAFSLEGEE